MHSLPCCRSRWQGRRYRSDGVTVFSLSPCHDVKPFLKPASVALHCPAPFSEKNFHWINNVLSCFSCLPQGRECQPWLCCWRGTLKTLWNVLLTLPLFTKINKEKNCRPLWKIQGRGFTVRVTADSSLSSSPFHFISFHISNEWCIFESRAPKCFIYQILNSTYPNLYPSTIEGLNLPGQKVLISSSSFCKANSCLVYTIHAFILVCFYSNRDLYGGQDTLRNLSLIISWFEWYLII